MKSFFEFFGFIATALISGALVFMYVGHNKNGMGSSLKELTSNNDTESSAPAELPSLASMRGKKGGSTSVPASKNQQSKTSALPKTEQETSADVAERLRYLYDDQNYVNATIKRWKQRVADASEENTVKPHVLLANVIVRSYVGEYSDRDFQNDVRAHGGDQVKSIDAAAKSYAYGWSVAKIAKQYNLAQYFPTAAPAPAMAAASMAPVSSKRTVAKSPASMPVAAKPSAKVAPSEAGFREMVAKEEGFSTWSGMQRLGDPETKQRADKKLKTLLMAARVR